MRTNTKFGIKIFEIDFVIEIKWFLTPPQSPRGRGKKNAVAHPIYMSNSHTKFGRISSNSLGGDSIIDRWTDAQTDGQTDRSDDDNNDLRGSSNKFPQWAYNRNIITIRHIPFSETSKVISVLFNGTVLVSHQLRCLATKGYKSHFQGHYVI